MRPERLGWRLPDSHGLSGKGFYKRPPQRIGDKTVFTLAVRFPAIVHGRLQGLTENCIPHDRHKLAAAPAGIPFEQPAIAEAVRFQKPYW